ncbi:BACON domain-containing protein [Desulfatirhabdium butyrativorans]|uniref:BACON domain-containing protein n=1 Tax=Desulfatirhabdium butyrativorans TaxID=340467 RepID=UPI000428E91D|nr:BACON domain-containing carbohydrate-binding protein [Desulfatirhabdium butyrativorans]
MFDIFQITRQQVEEFCFITHSKKGFEMLHTKFSKVVLPIVVSFVLLFGASAFADLTIPVLAVSPSSQAIGFQGGTLHFAILNTGSGTLNWNVTVPKESTDWIQVDKNSGTGPQSIKVTVMQYADNTDNTRTATLTIEAPGAFSSPRTVTITQYGLLTPVLTVDNATVLVPSGGASEQTLSVSDTGYAAFDWSAEVTEGGNWLKATTMTDETSGVQYIQYSVDPTNVTSTRYGTITISASNVHDADGNPINATIIGTPLKVSVIQSGSNYSLVVDTDKFSLSNKAQSDSFKVSFKTDSPIAMYPWTAQVSAGNEWLSIPSGSGPYIGAMTLTFHVTANSGSSSRVGSIVVSCSGAADSPITITVTQAGTSNNTVIGANPGISTVDVPVSQTVDLAINSTNMHGDKPVYQWFLVEMITSDGTTSPVYVLTSLGLFDVSTILNHLADYTFSFDPSGITSIGSWRMSDLGLHVGDTFIYAYAYQRGGGDIIVDNITTINVTE